VPAMAERMLKAEPAGRLEPSHRLATDAQTTVSRDLGP
jgi:hypothetical protein